MSRLWVAVTFLAAVLAATSLFAAPTINSVSPTSGTVGTSITINGLGYGTTQGTSTVKFNGTAGTPTSWSSTRIVVPVPTNATSGTIVVTVNGAASNGASFNVNPNITSLSPGSGPVGTSITISGSGFGATKGSSTVTFNGTTATPTSWSASSIVAPVPSGATTGNVRVTVNGIAGNNFFFIVGNGPGIASISPTSGPQGTSVTITGGNFGSTQGSSTVTFGGIAASVSSWASSSITAVVPNGLLAGSAAVVVTVNNIASNSVTFNDTNPVINSLSINSAPENQLITINGANFGASQGTNSSVTFNGTIGVPSSWSDTAISVPVPVGAATGNIVVTVNGAASYGYAFMVVPAPQPSGVHFIQGNYAIAGAVPSSIALPFPIGQTASDLNVVVVGWQGAYHVTSVVDSAGNTYFLAVGPTVGTTRRQSIYYAKNISSATTNAVTVSFASTCCAPVQPLAVDIRIAEYSGLNTTSPLDGTAGATGTGTTASSGFATTTNQYDLLVGAGVADGVINGAGSNYTSRVRPVNNGANNSDILEDRLVTATGGYDASATLQASATWVMQMVAFKEATNQAPVVNAGSNQTVTLPTNTATLQGTATDDGLPTNTLTISWSQVSGPGTATFNTPNQVITDATFPVAGTYVLQLTANDSQLSSSSSVTITVNSQAVSLTLNPLAAGPNVTGTSQTMTALLKNGTGSMATPISGASVAFTVTGANATTGSATTNSSGTATFTYAGTHTGTDTVTASYTGQNSNSANVSWLVPVQPVSLSPVWGRFYPFTGGYWCYFTTPGNYVWNPQGPPYLSYPPPATPLFTQMFPTINFNPPQGAVPGNTSGVDGSTRPFTDVATDVNGNFSGTVVAQGNGYQAGVGSLNAFESVFTGAFTVATPGQVTFNIYSDDGFLFGVGGGAQYVSGNLAPPNAPGPGVTPFQSYPFMATLNNPSAGGNMTAVVNFPTVGTYPFELDYVECRGGGLSLTLTSGVNNLGVPSSGTVQLTPTNPPSLNTGQTQSFTALVTDASGSVVTNTTVNFAVSGANSIGLTGTTDSTGHVTFQYTGGNAGIDTVEASAVISGFGQYSNSASVTWTPAPGSGAVTYVPQGWIGSPSIGAVIQGQVAISVVSGETLTSGILTYWPTSNPSAVTTLNSNTTGSSTLGTLDATTLPNGGYTIQLNATDSNNNSQISQITVSVVGNTKPGRMTATVTEFKVPLAGIPITIARTYDSLDRNKIEDFGYGWKLGTFVDLSVDAQNNVTFNFGGQKITFFFTPRPVFAGWLTPAYTAQAGAHGSLASDGCRGLMQLQSGLVCFPSTGQKYQPSLYAYTDPAGRTYTMTSSGQLVSIADLNGNTLTIAANGITSSVNGVVVPFVRDGSGRITQITDPGGNNYAYSYDGNGNLQSVQYPGLSAAGTYTYAADHSLLTETDPRGNTSTAVYYDSTNDGGNALLDGRLKSIRDTMQQTTSFSYNLTTKATTTTFPDGGVQTRTDDSFGKPLSITDPLNRTTYYQYDGYENLISMTDPLNNTKTYTYDANGFQTSVTDPMGQMSTKSYNQYGGVLSSTNAANTNTQTISYDAAFNPVQTTDLLNGAGTFVSSSIYDALGNVLTRTDSNGKTTQYAYDLNGNLIQVTDALNEVTHYAYDTMDRLIRQTDPLNNTTQFVYDALGRLTKKTDALGKITTYVYDNNGNKTSETDANNHTTSYQYDNMNRATKITYSDTTFKTLTYDFRGNKLTEVDQLGRTTKYVYDAAGQLSSVTHAYGTADAGTLSYYYDSDGRLQQVYDERGSRLAINYYDAAGRLTAVLDTLGYTTNYSYDADNRKVGTIDPNQHTTSYVYDGRSRLIKTVNNDNTSTQYTYDGVGRMLTTTDQAGIVTTKSYDAVGRLLSVKDALNNLTQYTYDLGGNLKTLQDAAGRVTVYQYDSLNRRSSRTLPLNQSESYTYDAVGNLATKTDFNGLMTTYNYDALNRLLSKVPQTGTGISFTYTATGQRASMADPSGTTSYTYDNRDRMLTKATPEGTLTYTYDAHGNVLTIISSNANGASLGYSYDGLNRVSQVCDNRRAPGCGGSGITTYTYDAAGNLSTYAYPNSVKTGYLYDGQSRLTQTCEATTSPACSASTKLASYAYTRGSGATYLVQQASTSSNSVTFSSANTAGNFIACSIRWYNGVLNSVSDTTGNAYRAAGSVAGAAGGEQTQMFYAYNIFGGSNTVSVSTTGGYVWMGCGEWHGVLATSDPLDQTNSSTGTGATATSGSISTTANNELVLGYVNSHQQETYNPGSGYTIRVNNTVTAIEDQIQSAAGSISASLSLSASTNWEMGVASFKTSPQIQSTLNAVLGVAELNGRNVAYGYDNDYRLTSEAISADPGGNNGAVNYVYDVIGNRAQMTSTLNAVPGGQFFYDNNDRLTTDVYDANGNTTVQASTTNLYDFENRMTQHGTGPGVLLAYDGDGNRVSEAIGGTTTKYLVDDLNPTNLPQVMDEVVNGSVTRTYAYGLDRISETQLVNSSWVPSFFGYDGGGSVRFLTNSAGTVTDAYDYDAFGMPIRTSGTTANPYHYGGEWLDSGVGLYHLRARYYNQATGRFWARDPVEGETDEPLSFNPYIYAGQDPTDKVDPTGLSTTVAPPGTLPWQPFKPTPTPNQPQARPGGGALAEYIAVIAMVSFAEIAASQRLAEIINCKFQKFATGVEAAVTSNLPPEDAGSCLDKPKKKCKDEFPKLINVNQLNNYPFMNQNQAWQDIRASYAPRQLKKTTRAPATDPPCEDGGPYQPGWHVNVQFAKGGGRAGSLVGCPCCEDTPAGPVPTERWGVR